MVIESNNNKKGVTLDDRDVNEGVAAGIVYSRVFINRGVLEADCTHGIRRRFNKTPRSARTAASIQYNVYYIRHDAVLAPRRCGRIYVKTMRKKLSALRDFRRTRKNYNCRPICSHVYSTQSGGRARKLYANT